MANAIIIATIFLGATGLVLAVALLAASKKFAVEEDPKLELLVNVLPGANCGGCGLAGCRNFAEKVLENPNGNFNCPVGGLDLNKKFSEILGIEVKETKPMTAILRCNGTTDNSAKLLEIYDGIADCRAAVLMYPGGKVCPYGCLGLGSCIRACKFDAIKKENGIVKIDEEKCVACGACIAACPKGLIIFYPKGEKVFVACSNNDRGGLVRTACKAGCIGCKKCEKTCEYGAVKVDNFCAVVDWHKCTLCGKCVKECPIGCISQIFAEKKAESKAV